MAQDEPAPALPLFHKNIVPLDPGVHGALKLNPEAGYAYSAGAEAIPIGIDEFEVAAHSYPILFLNGPQPIPVVMLGFRKGWNLFVDQSGLWMPGAYVPALVRAYPFALIKAAGSDDRWLGIEAETPCLSSERGLPLFEDSKPSPVLNEAMALCRSCEAGLAEGAALGHALANAGVLIAREATITAVGGGTQTIAGFMTIDPARLAAVHNEVFLAWRERNWLGPIYAHLFSAENWRSFTELAAGVLATRH